MYYEYPDSEDAYLARGQYFLGDQLFVAPIVSPTNPTTGLAEIDVWIPEGTWIEYTTLEIFEGPQWIRISGDLNRFPRFAKAGAIFPMAPHIMRTKEFDGTHLVLTLFPLADGEFELYEDDGTTTAYETDEYEQTAIRLLVRQEFVALTVAASEGYRPGAPTIRTLEVQLRGMRRPVGVTVNKAIHPDWTYSSTTSDLVVVIKDTNKRVPVDIVVALDSAEGSMSSPDTRQAGDPFVHCIDYDTFEDARQQLGTVIVVPPADHSPFDLEVVWQLQKGGQTLSIPATIQKQCNLEQIIHSPFADDGSTESFRWSVSVNMLWQGRSLHYDYQSQVAYPSINEWQTLIYNREQQPLSIADIVSGNGDLNQKLSWITVSQTSMAMLNLTQPFGIVLLEQERQRILDSEPPEAWVSTTLLCPEPQAIILCLQCVGEHSVYLNGNQLTAAAPIQHSKLQPVFNSWMPPQLTYYTLPLQQGLNRLMVCTRPDVAIGWWGIGATLFDQSGQVLTGLRTTE